MSDTPFTVIDRPRVELIGTYGSDETHALSAWTSTSRALTAKKKARIPELLRMLAESGHGTPFEKSSLHFLVSTDIATHIHILKHRHLSVNAESARYKEFKHDRAYVPADWPPESRAVLEAAARRGFQDYHLILDLLVKGGMDRKRAKESARFFLPYATVLDADVMFNFRSFVHFVRLRAAPDAQAEVRDVANQMLDLVRGTGHFTASLEAHGL